MMRRIAAAVLYAVVSVIGAGDAGAFDVLGGDDDGLLAFVGRDAADRADDGDDDASSDDAGEGRVDGGGGSRLAGGRDVLDGAEALLDRVSRACGTPVDAAWVARAHDGGTAAAVAVQADPHLSKAAINVALTRVEHDVPAVLFLPLTRALSHCRERGYLKIVLTADGAAVASLRTWVEDRGFQFARARWLDGAPAAEFYTDLYWSGSSGGVPPLRNVPAGRGA